MRHAVYFTPPEEDALTLAASAWLGRDAFGGHAVAQPSVRGFSHAEIAALTAEPRRYGFHATLKAPFSLADGCREADVLKVLEDFAGQQAAFDIPRLALAQIGPFFALVPDAPCDALEIFAAETVRRFEPFRAPLSAADIHRRNPEALSDLERENLHLWGYPYVFDAFLFHMTLTGAVPEDRRPAMRETLEEEFAAFIGRPLPVTALALFVEPERGGPFHVGALSPLGGRTEGDPA